MAKFEVFHGVFSSSIILLFLKSDVLFFLKNNISLNSNPQFDNSKCHKLLLNVYKFLWEVANLKTLIAFVTQLMLYAIYFFEVTSSTCLCIVKNNVQKYLAFLCAFLLVESSHSMQLGLAFK